MKNLKISITVQINECHFRKSMYNRDIVLTEFECMEILRLKGKHIFLVEVLKSKYNDPYKIDFEIC